MIFRIIKNEIEVLTWNRKNTQALNLLQKFLEENKDKTIVIKFFNKEKKHILKNIEKEKKTSSDKIKENARQEAMRLIWQTINLDKDKDVKKEKNIKKESFFEKIKEKLSFYKTLKEKLSFYKTLKEKRKRKKLFDEINILIEKDSKVKQDIAEKKLENIHRWLIKEISNENMLWYELYWKILGADKISWDTFWLYDDPEKYVFFLWDATWHWIRAWFIITLLSRLFNKYVKSSNIDELAYEINNWLKQDLKSRNFITWIFFEIIKKQLWSINFVWMWHEPMLVYRTKEAKVEKVIPWGLAAWIRIIKDVTNVKISHIELAHNDILITYSDWILENKNEDGEFYWIEKLTETFQKVASYTKDINEIYEYIINDLKLFKQWSNFNDDASVLLLKRNADKDIQDDRSEYLKNLTIKEWLEKKDVKKLIWKDKNEIREELKHIKKEKETTRVIKNLESLYYTWEILKLKQEAKRYINEWFIHKKINKYLKIAINKENEYKIEQKNNKMVNKFNILDQLEKKWDYNTVISEVENIIAKDWNI
jgi:serine phosphatase RsbU (regulator of sigma subunit)